VQKEFQITYADILLSRKWSVNGPLLQYGLHREQYGKGAMSNFIGVKPDELQVSQMVRMNLTMGKSCGWHVTLIGYDENGMWFSPPKPTVPVYS